MNKILEKADLLGLDYKGEIDFSRTKAYSSEKELEDEITIYVNAENEDEYEVIKNRVVDLFSDVYIDGIAQPISEISETEEGVVLKRNVLMQLSGNILISGESYPIEEFVLRRVISGRPTKEGILIAGGGRYKKRKCYLQRHCLRYCPDDFILVQHTRSKRDGR